MLDARVVFEGEREGEGRDGLAAPREACREPRIVQHPLVFGDFDDEARQVLTVDRVGQRLRHDRFGAQVDRDVGDATDLIPAAPRPSSTLDFQVRAKAEKCGL